MDLNQLYSEHQISLMRAAGAISVSARSNHLLEAGVIGGQIFDLLTSKNAAASVDWLPLAERFGQPADLCVSA